jgi:hypothetical protein
MISLGESYDFASQKLRFRCAKDMIVLRTSDERFARFGIFKSAI